MNSEAIEYTMAPTAEFLSVKAKGKGGKYDEAQVYVHAVILAIMENKSERVFCDEYELTHELSGIDIYSLGETVAKNAGHVERVAILCQVKDIPKQNFTNLLQVTGDYT